MKDELEQEFASQEEYLCYYFADGVPFYCNEEIPLEEAVEYVKRGRDIHGSRLCKVKCILKGEEIDIMYDLYPRPFERIRRITGYLVGTLDRFNDAKRAEESQRVKHGIPHGE